MERKNPKRKNVSRKKEKEKKGKKKTKNIIARSRNINGILVTGFLKAEEICSVLLFEFERSGIMQ